jgi:hypothetical protein
MKTTTPLAGHVVELLGAALELKNVGLTRDELFALRALYCVGNDANPLLQAGADRNLLRQAEEDGFRLLAWLAKYVPAGTDPLKVLIQIASHAGWDVDPEDAAWSNDDSP